MGCKFCKVKHTSAEIREKRREIVRQVKDAGAAACGKDSSKDANEDPVGKPGSDTSSYLSISTLNEDTESSLSKVPSTISSVSSVGSLTRYDRPAVKKPETPARGYNADDLEIIDLENEDDDLESLTCSSGKLEESCRPRAAKGERRPILKSCVDDFKKDVDAFIATHSTPTVGSNGKIARPSAARGVRLPCYVPPSQICQERETGNTDSITNNPAQTRSVMTRPQLTVPGLVTPDSNFLQRWIERQKNVSPRSAE
ncbi:hypothetical protein FSP39_019943 [Pinctada imbricata]|uniref:Uncharacterized protein n=1 Tax=Pinctada imbricata TaxID=66713 RepID=A0AA88Y6E2_PINIB|nr:hypothetical protein FSP39_019943 [Pinctada imbricata]